MPKINYWLQRLERHLVLAVAAVTTCLLAYAATPPPDVRHRLSMATAYAGLVFLAASLWLGPWNVLRRQPNPISFDLRRDVGIWEGHSCDSAYGDRLDGPSSRKDVDVLLQTASSTEAAKYAIRLCKFYWAGGCPTVPDALDHL
jgi:hypothetical protein